MTNDQWILIDTVSDPGNTWRIGHPSKAVFNIANSGENALVTDLTDPYPVNDTSSFIIPHIASDGWAFGYPKIDIGGYYSVDSDTLTDYGFIDFSADHGASWHRVDSVEGDCTWGAMEELPVFSGSSGGWRHFYYCLVPPFTVAYGDTVLYRFTFISDSVQTYRDGLMFDDLHFEDWAEAIEEFDAPSMTVAPSPASDELQIRFRHPMEPHTLRMIGPTGQLLWEIVLPRDGKVDLSGLANGVYVLQCFADGMGEVERFVVDR